jgi:hypothetical protein
MPYAQPSQFDLREEVREDVETVWFQRLDDALRGARERNEDIADFNDLRDGAQMAGMPKPYPGACDLVSTIIPENIGTLIANLSVFYRQDTLAYAKAILADDKEKARKKESWLAHVWHKEGMSRILDLYTDNLLTHPAAVIYAGYCERTVQKQVERYAEFDPKTQWFRYWNEEKDEPDDILEPEDRVEGVQYASFFVTIDDKERGGEYRVVELSDFYLYPPTAESVEKAQVTFERLMLTEDDLLTGIDTYGYDKSIVMDMIRHGPTHRSDGNAFAGDSGEEINQQKIHDRGGVSAELRVHGDGYYECFLAFGKLPKLWEDGDARLPEKYWQTEATGLLCWQHKLVPLLKPCEYPRKPYYMESLFRRNRRALGQGMVQRLEPLAQEATHSIRQYNNSVDMDLLPEYVADDETWDRNPNKQSFLGKWWRVSGPDGLLPLRKDRASPLGMDRVLWTESKAQALSASQGYGQTDPKSRKAAEVNNTVNAAATKFDYYGWSAYGGMIPKLAACREEWELLFNPDSVTQINTLDGEMEVTADDLRAPVQWSAAQMQSDSSPEAKERRNEAVLNVQTGYMKSIRQFPENAEHLWEGARQALLDMGERQPEKLLGEKPPPFVPPPVMPMGAPGMAPMGGMPGMGMDLGALGGLPGTGLPPGLPPMPAMGGNGNGMASR